MTEPRSRAAGPDGVVLADPKGNEFCAFPPTA